MGSFSIFFRPKAYSWKIELFSIEKNSSGWTPSCGLFCQNSPLDPAQPLTLHKSESDSRHLHLTQLDW